MHEAGPAATLALLGGFSDIPTSSSDSCEDLADAHCNFARALKSVTNAGITIEYIISFNPPCEMDTSRLQKKIINVLGKHACLHPA